MVNTSFCRTSLWRLLHQAVFRIAGLILLNGVSDEWLPHVVVESNTCLTLLWPGSRLSRDLLFHSIVMRKWCNHPRGEGSLPY